MLFLKTDTEGLKLFRFYVFTLKALKILRKISLFQNSVNLNSQFTDALRVVNQLMGRVLSFWCHFKIDNKKAELIFTEFNSLQFKSFYVFLSEKKIAVNIFTVMDLILVGNLHFLNLSAFHSLFILPAQLLPFSYWFLLEALS